MSEPPPPPRPPSPPPPPLSSPPPRAEWGDRVAWSEPPGSGPPLRSPWVAPPGPMPPPPLPQAQPPALAGWGERFGAWILDLLVVSVPAGFVFVLLALVLPTEEPRPCVTADGTLGTCEDLTDGSAVVVILYMLAWCAAAVFGYFAVLEGRRGQTVGKRATGIKVVDARTGQPIGYGRGVGRFFARILSSAPCYLGYLWPLWDRRRQAFHDKAVGSVVVRAGR